MKISGSDKQRWILWSAFTLLIAVVSLAPSRSFKDVPTFSYEDKIVHFTMYGIEASLLLWALAPKIKNTASRLIATILFSSAYGILMEILQPLLQPGDRTFSIGDITANIAGAVCLSLIMVRRITKK